MAEELLQAADQYMLEGLKRLCEAAISTTLSVDSLQTVYELSENFNAPQLGRRCVLFALEAYTDMVEVRGSCPTRDLADLILSLKDQGKGLPKS